MQVEAGWRTSQRRSQECVGRGVVTDHVHLQPGRHRAVDADNELLELGPSVAGVIWESTLPASPPAPHPVERDLVTKNLMFTRLLAWRCRVGYAAASLVDSTG
jgi:hypothetical protein